jgi:aminopeptidase-like protein
LSYGELFIPGSSDAEILFSTHTCHPSLCNDNLSGIATTALLARELMRAPQQRYGVRFLFVPATLGPLVWLSRNEQLVPRVLAGLVIAGVGDRGALTYVKTRHGRTLIDRAMLHVLRHIGARDAAVREFVPMGYDQRQYCSPGFNMPVGCVMRTPDGEYPEYHTSADDLGFVTAASLGGSWEVVRLATEIVQADRRYLNTLAKGEPRLGARGLFDDVARLGILWTLNFSDGSHSLLDIAERSNSPFWSILEGARRLEDSGLLIAIDDEDS